VAWGAGKGNFFGTWPLVWHHLIDTPGSKAFVAAFTKKYGKPPENQAWGDYITMKILAQTMNETKTADPLKIIEHWEKEPKFDVLKTRPGYFRKYDHQLMHEMYAVEALKASELKNQWDIYKPASPTPGPNEPLEAIASTPEENACNMAA
jgi:branched-chain amino acid transport system substrate-binding protein